ncbi:hypothetical protein P692DRAFT_20232991 [Suillus brevipes Sb2]|nr:hypothetical protein P692DRAFT_20232991 [Suillus brevipes Sb2]
MFEVLPHLETRFQNFNPHPLPECIQLASINHFHCRGPFEVNSVSITQRWEALAGKTMRMSFRWMSGIVAVMNATWVHLIKFLHDLFGYWWY